MGEPGLKRYIAALFRYKWMILGILTLGTALGVALASQQTPIYQVSAKVWIGSGLAGGQAGAPIRQGELLGLSGWEQLLRSSAVLDSVVRKHRLFLGVTQASDTVAFATFQLGPQFRDGAYTLQVQADGRSFVLTDASGLVLDRGALGEPIGENAGFEWTPLPGLLPVNRPVEFKVTAPSVIVQSLQGRLIASEPRDDFMNIALRGSNREEITATLTAIVQRFEEVSLELKRRRLTETAKILEEQLRLAEQNLTVAENELQAFRVRTITMPAAQGVPVPAGLQSTEPSALGNYFKLTAEKDQYGRDRESIERALNDRSPEVGVVTALELIPSVRQSSELARALTEAAERDATIRALKVQLTDLNPQVIEQQRHLDSLKQHIIPAYAQQLMQQLEAMERQQDTLIAASAMELREIPARSAQEANLQRRVAIADQMYRELETQHHRADLAEVTTVPDMQILDKPTVPFMPVQDPRFRMLLMCMGGSLGLALAGAILRDRLDPRLRYPDEVTAGMGLFILGAVPALRRGRLGATDMAVAIEAFRAIQLSVVHAHGDETPLALTISSPGASDGKSFVTSNLAIAFAEMGHRTLVIDGDVRRGTIHQLMGTTHKPGLTDYLAGHARRDEVVQNTRYTMLDMIGCGSRGEAGPKLLGSNAMSRLMEELRQDYDLILVDSPPLGACVDPMILGTLTRNLILVLRTGTTDRVMAESKLETLDRLPVRVLGAVLNDVPARGPYRYYSYLSGYEVLDEVQVGEEVGSLPASEDAEDFKGGRDLAG